jgi:16S rRNA (guanine527-N7)-methyltransferase
MNGDPRPPLSLEQIALALSPFTAGVRISSEALGKIRAYIELLAVWNQSVSLTAIDDKLEIAARHFGESIFAASVVSLQSGRLADVGSGAGFPGLPLKIVSEGLNVVLLEPNLKKCAFLNEVTRELALKDVEISRSRYEDYRSSGSSFDFVCSRALGDYRRLLRWAKAVLAPCGRVILWLGEEDSILLGRTRAWSWDLPVRIPESSRRVLQVGRPILE